MRASRFLTGQRCLVEFRGEPSWAHERVELLAVYQDVRGVPTQVVVLTPDGERNVESRAQYGRRLELDHRHVVHPDGWAANVVQFDSPVNKNEFINHYRAVVDALGDVRREFAGRHAAPITKEAIDWDGDPFMIPDEGMVGKLARRVRG